MMVSQAGPKPCPRSLRKSVPGSGSTTREGLTSSRYLTTQANARSPMGTTRSLRADSNTSLDARCDQELDPFPFDGDDVDAVARYQFALEQCSHTARLATHQKPTRCGNSRSRRD